MKRSGGSKPIGAVLLSQGWLGIRLTHCRPKKFEKKTYDDDSDSEEESNVGKMPPSDSEDEDER